MIADRIDPLVVSQTRKKLIKSPRYLFFDMGVRRLAAQEGVDQPQVHMGHLLEQWVGLEIQKYIRNHKSKASLHFWQDPERAEVDWVIKVEKNYIPIEVKLTSSPQEKDCKHLLTFQQEYPCKHGVFLVSTIPRPQKMKSGVHVIPWQNLTQLLSDFLK
jgi:predicted AAA+ superfamily ATPase